MSLLELPSLEERRVREDLIEVFNLLKGIVQLDYSLFFKLSGDSKVRGHTYKIVNNSFRWILGKISLVIEWWMHGMSCLSMWLMQKLLVLLRQDETNSIRKYNLNNLMPRIFKHLEAGCLQVNLMSTTAQINQLKYTILYYIDIRLSR